MALGITIVEGKSVRISEIQLDVGPLLDAYLASKSKDCHEEKHEARRRRTVPKTERIVKPKRRK